jgi:hypothetical protein
MPAEAAFDAFPKPLKAKLLALRRLIFDTAGTIEGLSSVGYNSRKVPTRLVWQ